MTDAEIQAAATSLITYLSTASDAQLQAFLNAQGGTTASMGTYMQNLLGLASTPTYDDMTAIGVLHALYRTTHNVPDEISVVGFDDIHLAQFMLPPLTTVQMSCKDLAAAAVEALRAGIEPNHARTGKIEWHIPTRLVVRQSSAFPRGSLPALMAAKRRSAQI